MNSLYTRTNAIESVFSELKYYLSTGTTRTFEELEKEINTGGTLSTIFQICL